MTPTSALSLLAAGALVGVPSITVDKPLVAPGDAVVVSGAALSCRTGDTLTVGSKAFAGPGFAGLGGVSVRVGRFGVYRAVAHVARSAQPGLYPVTARCGGGNLGGDAQVLVTSPLTEAVTLRPLPGSGVGGRVTYEPSGGGIVVWAELHGLGPQSRARVLFHDGTCSRHSASFALGAVGVGGPDGRLSVGAPLRFHGSAVPIETVNGGGKVFVVVAAGREAACAPVPGIR